MRSMTCTGANDPGGPTSGAEVENCDAYAKGQGCDDED